jgi:hypothetical protein
MIPIRRVVISAEIESNLSLKDIKAVLKDCFEFEKVLQVQVNVIKKEKK